MEHPLKHRPEILVFFYIVIFLKSGGELSWAFIVGLIAHLFQFEDDLQTVVMEKSLVVLIFVSREELGELFRELTSDAELQYQS